MADYEDCEQNDHGLYEEVGTMAGTVVTPEGEETIDIVGIIYPDNWGGEEVRCMTLACAKALLIDLRDAIEAAVSHKQERK